MGKLVLLLEGCTGLETGFLVGTPSPYAEVRCENKVYRTPVERRTASPRWNKRFHLYLSDEEAEVQIRVLDHNILANDKVLETYTMSLRGLRRGIVLVRHCSLQHGELHMRLLAVDFGLDPTPSQAWMVTTDLASDPVQRAVERGTYVRVDYLAAESVAQPSPQRHSSGSTSVSTDGTGAPRAARKSIPFALPLPPRLAARAVTPSRSPSHTATTLFDDVTCHPEHTKPDPSRNDEESGLPPPLYAHVTPQVASDSTTAHPSTADTVTGIPLVNVATPSFVGPVTNTPSGSVVAYMWPSAPPPESTSPTRDCTLRPTDPRHPDFRY